MRTRDFSIEILRRAKDTNKNITISQIKFVLMVANIMLGFKLYNMIKKY